MKLTKNSNLLFVGLALILSLVSFNGFINHAPSETHKTTLVKSDSGDDRCFSIKYHNILKANFSFTWWYSSFSFNRFQNYYSLTETTFFKNYTQKTLGLKAKQIHTQLYNISSHQKLYNNIIDFS